MELSKGTAERRRRAVAIVRAASYEPEVVAEASDRLFSLLGEDGLATLIRPGDRVFVKPNWVAHQYRRSCPRQDSLYSTITHPAVIRQAADVVAHSLGGRGAITIGDNPSIDADFQKLMEEAALDDLRARYDVPVEILDLRPLVCTDLREYGKKERMQSQRGDPGGRTTVNLGRDSLLANVNPRLFRGVFDDRRDTVASHTGNRQEYTFSSSIVGADVYLSVPKLKTHHKVGTTLNLKGLVGTIAEKNQLVHWRVGFPGVGGDEYGSFFDWCRGLVAPVKKRGAWPGNDTIWRMVVDLHRAFRRVGPSRTFSIVDGILGGEGNGPFCPTGKTSNVLVAGSDLLLVDIVATRLMGFDPLAIPYLRHLIEAEGISYSDIDLRSEDVDTTRFFEPSQRHLAFVPPGGWAL